MDTKNLARQSDEHNVAALEALGKNEFTLAKHHSEAACALSRLVLFLDNNPYYDPVTGEISETANR
ncbi:MAG: hypothetical protein GY838_12880 [bacterium]|nr:hypothetical protein [bacterium]